MLHDKNRREESEASNRDMTERDRQTFISQSARILDAMANPKRLEVLTRLAARETSVGALSDLVGLSHSALSQHLSKLRGTGLVSTRRHAQTVYYSCSSSAVLHIHQLLNDVFTA